MEYHPLIQLINPVNCSNTAMDSAEMTTTYTKVDEMATIDVAQAELEDVRPEVRVVMTGDCPKCRVRLSIFSKSQIAKKIGVKFKLIQLQSSMYPFKPQKSSDHNPPCT